MHMLRADDPHFSRLGELYFSVICPGVIKAWHLHSRMIINYAVVVGTEFESIIDGIVREGGVVVGYGAAAKPRDRWRAFWIGALISTVGSPLARPASVDTSNPAIDRHVKTGHHGGSRDACWFYFVATS